MTKNEIWMNFAPKTIYFTMITKQA